MIDSPPAVVEVYFDSSCAPCRRELPALARAAGEEGLPLAIIILGDEEHGRWQLAAVSPALSSRVARAVPVNDTRAALRAAGNDEGVLPYSRAVKADGKMCGQWRGMLSVERIRALLAACK